MGSVRIAVIAEQFLPHMNGVTHSVLRVLEHLRSRGHQVIVICPSADPLQVTRTTEALDGAALDCPILDGIVVHRLPAVPLTGYPEVRLAAGTPARVRRILKRFGPDLVHLASPFVLGWRGVQAAHQLGIPSAAVYQTEIPGYAARYGAPFLEEALWSHVHALHSLATVTLAPSSSAVHALHDHGVQRVHLWRRGVDAVRFDPARRDEALRQEIGGGRRLIGYVGRLAPEKQVEDLARLDALPGARLVIVGSGPDEPMLRRRLPNAHFAGFQGGEDLARWMASFDVFVHPGEFETFCQTIQEAMASGVPVVATGRGGPLDLVDQSRTGWLYRPGDLDRMQAHVQDLVGDEAKRAAFARAARAAVETRTWSAIGDQLLEHYERALVTDRRRRSVHRTLPVG